MTVTSRGRRTRDEDTPRSARHEDLTPSTTTSNSSATRRAWTSIAEPPPRYRRRRRGYVDSARTTTTVAADFDSPDWRRRHRIPSVTPTKAETCQDVPPRFEGARLGSTPRFLAGDRRAPCPTHRPKTDIDSRRMSWESVGRRAGGRFSASDRLGGRPIASARACLTPPRGRR